MAGVSRRTEVIVNIVVCVGAAIVIFGAWAKILHKSFADIMLTIGLLTEAFIFLVYAFLPPPYSAPPPVAAGESGNPALKSLDKMLQEADITPTNLQRLSAGFSKLGTTVDKMGEIGDVVKSTGDFSANARAAADAMGQVKGAMDKTVGAMNSFNEASESTKQFHGQVQNLTKNLGALNAIYELELQDTNNHLKAMNKFFGNLSAVSESMAGSVDDAKQAQAQINQLANNLAKLNNVYGNMLSAMQGRS
ncbi:MAG: gliding motility protein GldL [Chitinophagaceae bacterium]|nr:gliding motility protein GldL [Chitinophagaceae bacterium]